MNTYDRDMLERKAQDAKDRKRHQLEDDERKRSAEFGRAIIDIFTALVVVGFVVLLILSLASGH